MSFIMTFTGKHIDFRNISENSFSIEDIATALSNTCRFAGHLENFYSVAQHSVHCSELVAPELAFEALMHDAAEAYLGDVTAPLKALLPDYRRIEKQVETAIRQKYKLPQQQTPAVKRADLIMLATERRDFGMDDGTPWVMLDGIAPASFVIEPMPPRQAKALFIKQFFKLGGLSNIPLEDWR
ncbi:hypothetical protein [Pantoea stewartii]|uniref:Phage protein n=1 Tax=Pantoea stewartii subsp. stewartii DC283 TaxID=660596 RepID=H3REC4_PANSE|nr:hypothetical protein [Pantoea stewartii]ARF50630.1 hypothetical protein DSJ_15645 [Pantoea stewartii subsp. stewartii DC283]EHU00100.1 phage protein [Pantoea stewartii subsp. stewartii DC283]KAB0554514.1 HD family hydrolase [Pantoea stewartii subsp. stewartii]